MPEQQVTKTAIRAAMQTDIGMVREHNEDSAYVDPENHFFIVADGMGGHAAGEVASAMAVESVQSSLAEAVEQLDEFASTPTDEGRKSTVATLEAAVRTAHQAVYDRGVAEPDKQGMGTTLDVVLVAGSEAFVAHVGDSRTYLIRNGKAAQVTTDHTVAEVLVIEGKLSAEEAQISPLRTILVNAIGVAPDVGVEMAHIQLRKGDKFLVCSDGLHDYFLAEQELAKHILADEPAKALETLVELAKERGGQDNITGVVVEIVDCAPPPDGVPVATTFEVSNGVPAPISRDDTMPVDLADSADAMVRTRARRDTSPGVGVAQTNGSAAKTSDDDIDEDKTDETETGVRDTVKLKRPDDMLRVAHRETAPFPTVAPGPELSLPGGDDDTIDGSLDDNAALRMGDDDGADDDIADDDDRDDDT